MAAEPPTSAEAELDAIASALAHDLRAPLRAIDGFSRILLGPGHADGLPDDTQRYLALVRDAGSELAELLDDLVDVVRLGRAPLDLREVDVAALARSVIAAREEGGSATPAWRVAGDVPVCRADPILLRRLLEELIDNAVKFGGRTVSVSWDADRAAYAVADDGIGLDGELPDQALALFGRLQAREAYPGTGAGLALAARIAARHGGRLWGHGAPGAGTTVWFTLAPAPGEA
jgi:signal transduction histidine kinase